MPITLLIFVVLFRFGYSEDLCPGFITCETSENPDSCPEGTFYREKIKVHGCCPGCKSLADENETCNIPADCQPGLTCKEWKRCEKDSSQACEFYKRFDSLWKKTKYWTPVCSADGTYAPKQCKGEKVGGKCFCVNKMGKRIFGEEQRSRAESMTCACSRLVEDLKSKGLEVTFRCDHQGNFEPLQCDQKVCWCANPTTGIPYTAMVPLETMISLPCYRWDVTGAQYYRQCDSSNHMQEVVKSLLRNHGTNGIILTSNKCNFDGSYHRVQDLREKKRCVFINNQVLTEAIESANTNCNCAYDRHVAQLHQTDFLADCEYNGNYKKRQVWNEKVYCIDEDGFYYSSDPKDCP